jgi:hypothetical protein
MVRAKRHLGTRLYDSRAFFDLPMMSNNDTYVAMGPYTNVAYGPRHCPWGGPTEGDDKDYFFLTRGEEYRFFFDVAWDEDDWQDWCWKRTEHKDVKDELLKLPEVERMNHEETATKERSLQGCQRTPLPEQRSVRTWIQRITLVPVNTNSNTSTAHIRTRT